MNRVFISKLLGGIALLITFLFVMSINLNNWFFKPTSARAGNTQPLQAVNWPKVSLVKIAGGFSQPTAIVDAGDHSGRLFITEQPGTIHILSLQSGTMLPTPFLDIRDRVQFQAGSEQGLLGLAFPPNYASKGYFYVYYTQKDWTEVVSRFKISSANIADPNSEVKIIILPHPSQFSNHNGGQLQFGPDGYLYIGVGDGGGGGDPYGNGQNLGTTLAKILRIDVESAAPGTASLPLQNPPYKIYLPLIDNSSSGKPANYIIPPNNPFVGKSNAAPEIWAYGLRNPWRFSFDKQTGDLYIADVGQNLYEEVDFQPANAGGGQNYGWNIMEGAHCYNSTTCDQIGLALPVLEYAHGTSDSTGCAIIGGYVYRGFIQSWQGFYFFSDYCSGNIWAATSAGGWQFQSVVDPAQLGHHISTFGQDIEGNLYVADGASGDIFVLQP